MILIGELSLWLAILMAAWAFIASFAGGTLRRTDLIASGQRATWAAFGFTGMACAGVLRALATRDLSLRAVAESTTLNLPTIYSVGALWLGPRGPALVWAFSVSLLAAAMVFAYRRRSPVVLPYATGTLGLLTLGLLVATVMRVNPYARLDWLAGDGLGLPPRLQHAGVLLQVPLIALGAAATTVPLALLCAALVTRDISLRLVRAMRDWNLLAWCLLSGGVLCGMWWAYHDATLHDEWQWYAVRNASLLAWLGSSLLLHTLSESRGAHRWRRSSAALVIITVTLSALAVVWHPASGVVPLTNRASTGLGQMLLALTAVVALIASRSAAACEVPMSVNEPDSASSERTILTRTGTHLSHAGAIILIVGLLGSVFRSAPADVTVAVGEDHETVDPWGARWRFSSDGVSNYEALNRTVTALSLRVSRNDQVVGTLVAEQRQYLDAFRNVSFAPTTEVEALGTMREDVVVMLSTLVDAQTAVVRIQFTPLLRWVWVGGFLMLLGGVLVLLSTAGSPRDHSPSSRHVS